jgi:hypothetical protein
MIGKKADAWRSINDDDKEKRRQKCRGTFANSVKALAKRKSH